MHSCVVAANSVKRELKAKHVNVHGLCFSVSEFILSPHVFKQEYAPFSWICFDAVLDPCIARHLN